MPARKRTVSPIQRLIVRLREDEKYTYEKIGKELQMGKSAVRKVYMRTKNPVNLKAPGRPRVTDKW